MIIYIFPDIGQPAAQSNRWSPKETRALVAAVKARYQNLVNAPDTISRGQVWDLIIQDFRASAPASQRHRSRNAIRDKWNAILNEYKDHVDKHERAIRRTGEAPVEGPTWQLWYLMESFLADDPGVRPAVTMDTFNGERRRRDEETEADNGEGPSARPAQRRRTTATARMREVQGQAQQETVQLFRQMLDVQSQFVRSHDAYLRQMQEKHAAREAERREERQRLLDLLAVFLHGQAVQAGPSGLGFAPAPGPVFLAPRQFASQSSGSFVEPELPAGPSMVHSSGDTNNSFSTLPASFPAFGSLSVGPGFAPSSAFAGPSSSVLASPISTFFAASQQDNPAAMIPSSSADLRISFLLDHYGTDEENE